MFFFQLSLIMKGAAYYHSVYRLGLDESDMRWSNIMVFHEN